VDLVATEPTRDPYARTRRKEARLRYRIARAHLKSGDHEGYERALEELYRLGMGIDEGGKLIPIEPRSRVQALRSYLASAEKVAGVGEPAALDPALLGPPQVHFHIDVPALKEVVKAAPKPVIDVQVVPEIPTLPAPPPAPANGNGHTNGHTKEG
jgi:hypothetical protein